MTKTTNKKPVTLDDISSALCKKLEKHGKITPILRCSEEHEVSFALKAWKNSKHLNDEISDMVEKIIGKFEYKKNHKGEKVIYRKCIFDMVEEIKDAKSRTLQLKKVFLATMVWGYENVGYGSHRVGRMTKNPDLFSKAITKSYECISNDDIEGAYDIFAEKYKLEMLGPAFFTKYLYFIGGSCQPRPLILDDLVEKELKDYRVWTLINRYAKQGKKSRYIAYVNGVNMCADKLGVCPGDIECFLFQRQWKKREINKEMKATPTRASSFEKNEEILLNAGVKSTEYKYLQLKGDLEEGALNEIYSELSLPKKKQ